MQRASSTAPGAGLIALLEGASGHSLPRFSLWEAAELWREVLSALPAAPASFLVSFFSLFFFLSSNSWIILMRSRYTKANREGKSPSVHARLHPSAQHSSGGCR